MLYISHIYQSIHSRLFSKFKITYNAKPDNKTHGQLTCTCNVSAKPMNYMKRYLTILTKFAGYSKAKQMKSVR